MSYMKYEGGTSVCPSCGHVARGPVFQCPQCRQIKLQEEHNRLLKEGANGGASSGGSAIVTLVGGAALLFVGAVVVGIIRDLFDRFFAWVGRGIETTWGIVSAPFKHGYAFFVTDWRWWKLVVLAVVVIWLLSLFSGDAERTRKPVAARKNATRKKVKNAPAQKDD